MSSRTSQVEPSKLRFRAPRAVRIAALDGLRMVHEGYGGRGLTKEAIQRAINLARGGEISLLSRGRSGRTIKSSAQFMHAWFARHKVDKRPGWRARKTPGWVAWQIWGGDAGRKWVRQIMKTYARGRSQ